MIKYMIDIASLCLIRTIYKSDHGYSNKHVELFWSKVKKYVMSFSQQMAHLSHERNEKKQHMPLCSSGPATVVLKLK